MNLALSPAARWTIWSVSLALLCGIAWTRLDQAIASSTPTSWRCCRPSTVRRLAAATDRSRDAFVHQVLVLVSGDDVPATRDAALARRAG